MSSLNQYHILITRPEPQASKLSTLLESNGAKTLIFSTLQISYTQNMDGSYVKKIGDYDLAIFTSAHSVTGAMPYWPKSFDTMLIAVGPTTQQYLRDMGYDALIPESSFSSNGVLDLPICRHVFNKKILLCSGVGGNSTLDVELKKRGAIVDKAELYRRHCPEAPSINQLTQWKKTINLIISTSQESLSNLVQITKPIHAWLFETPLLVISKNMAQFAQNQGFKEVIIAKNATDHAIYEALK